MKNLIGMSFADDTAQVYTAGIENVVKVWDLRKEEVAMSLKGHNDTVTGMAVSPDGTHLLTNAMDNTLRVSLKYQNLDRPMSRMSQHSCVMLQMP